MITIVFVVFIIAGVFAVMRSGNKGGAKAIRTEYEGKILEEGTFNGSMCYFITDDRLILQKYTGLYAVYMLDSIRYVSAWREPGTGWVFIMADEEYKPLRAEDFIGGTAANRKMYGNGENIMPSKDAEKLCEAVVRHASKAEQVNWTEHFKK